MQITSITFTSPIRWFLDIRSCLKRNLKLGVCEGICRGIVSGSSHSGLVIVKRRETKCLVDLHWEQLRHHPTTCTLQRMV